MDVLLWQLADSAFPAGGFAHSGGLEAAARHGEVRHAADLDRFVRVALRQAGHGALPLVTAAHKDPDGLAWLDALCDAFFSNPVANRASRALGRAFLSTCARSFPQSSISRLEDTVRRQNLCAHHAPVFGAVMRSLAVDKLQTVRLFLYLVSRNLVTAGVRLGLVGPYEAQQLQVAIGPEIDRTLERCAKLEPLDVVQTAPLVDLWQSTHDRLYSRIFQS